MRVTLINIFCSVFSCSLLLLCACNKPGEEEKALPIITAINPASGGVNTTIYITGQGLSSLKDSAGCIPLYFQNKQACAVVRNDDTLEVTVPFDAGDGPLCIDYRGKRYCTSQSFNYLPGNPSPNSFMRLADCPSTATNQVAAMGATNDAIIAGFINWWKYDIDKNTWAVMPSPADKLTRMASFTFNGKAYFFGGYNAGFSNRLQCYDGATNTWSFKAPMPSTPRADASAFVWNNKVYIAGGADSYTYGMNTVYRQLWQYDPVSDSWQRKTDLPQGAIEGAYALRIGARFYIPTAGNGVQEYDPQTDTWTQFGATENLPLYAAPFSDRDFALGYTVGGSVGSYGTGTVNRYAINYTGNHFFVEAYGQPPANGYVTAGAPFCAVVNNELYYGMAYQNVNGVQARDNQLWRYRY